MSDHAMNSRHAPVEVEPTEPDANGERWRQFKPGTVRARCSCGLTLEGPQPAVTPLVAVHQATSHLCDVDIDG